MGLGEQQYFFANAGQKMKEYPRYKQQAKWGRTMKRALNFERLIDATILRKSSKTIQATLVLDYRIQQSIDRHAGHQAYTSIKH